MKKRQVFVMGSFVVDLVQRVDKLPIPGETRKASSFEQGSGGKGSNQAIASAKCGARTSFAGKIGRDSFGELGKSAWSECGVDATAVTTSEQSPSGSALIMVDERSGQNMISVALGACLDIQFDDVAGMLSKIRQGDVFLTQLETNLDVVWQAIGEARKREAIVILNPAPVSKIPDHAWKKIDYITPNESEAAVLAGMPVNNHDDAIKAAKIMLDKGIRKGVVITLGDKGFVFVSQNGSIGGNAFRIEAIDTTGAGDAFNGAFACAISEGEDVRKALQFANACAAISTTRHGTAKSVPWRSEIEAFLKENEMHKNP